MNAVANDHEGTLIQVWNKHCTSIAASHEDVGVEWSVEHIVTQGKFHDSKQQEHLKHAHVDVVRGVVQ